LHAHPKIMIVLKFLGFIHLVTTFIPDAYAFVLKHSYQRRTPPKRLPLWQAHPQIGLHQLGIQSQFSFMIRAGTSTAPQSDGTNLEALRQLIKEKDKSDSFEKIELTPDNIAKMIDVTFVKGCMDLAQGYVDVLKLMIVSTQAAYTNGISFIDLEMRVNAIKESVANRPLMPEEIELRSAWMSVIYLTLSMIGYQQETVLSDLTDGIRQETSHRFKVIVQDIIETGKDKVSVSDLKVEQFRSHANSESDPLQKAILSQSIRVILLTLLVVEEETKCIPATPRPPIPGAN